MSLEYINTVAPEHCKTSCSEAEPINARYSDTDFGGCYRCTLLCAGEDVTPKEATKDEVRKRR